MRTSNLNRILGFVSIGLVFGCSKGERLYRLEQVDLNAAIEYAEASATFCTRSASEKKQRVKYLFVLDRSGSNQGVSISTDPPVATDPTGARRFGSLLNFLANTPEDPGYTYFHLLNFSTGAWVPDGMTGFTDDKAAFTAVVTQEKKDLLQDDTGYTDYQAALTKARQVIQADAQSELDLAIPGSERSSLYVMIFVSDGVPRVRDNTVPNGYRNLDYAADIQGLIIDPTQQSLAELKNDPTYKKVIEDIILHTGFYTSISAADLALYDPTEPSVIEAQAARSLLAQMAVDGGGDSFVFGAGAAVSFELFALPVRHVKYVLTDVFVENASTVWWDDGRISSDFDGDGLSDAFERKIGSNPFERDSDGNGVSDGVEYRIKGRPCKDAACSRDASLRDNYAGCSGLMPPTWPDGSVNPKPDGVNAPPGGTVYFADRDGDRLNDCEEWILRSLRDEFDSNGDLIPDYLSFKNRLAFTAGNAIPSGDPDSDQVSNYVEIKSGMPIYVSNSAIPEHRPIKVSLTKVGTEADTDCYSLSAKDIATLGWDNLIRIYLVENASVVENRSVLRVAEGRLQGGSKVIMFSKGEFK